jgi:hypothetical protein
MYVFPPIQIKVSQAFSCFQVSYNLQAAYVDSSEAINAGQ